MPVSIKVSGSTDAPVFPLQKGARVLLIGNSLIGFCETDRCVADDVRQSLAGAAGFWFANRARKGLGQAGGVCHMVAIGRSRKDR